jgi:magnesium chelatase subunit D
MGVQKRMEQVKGVVFSVLQTNYIYRDKVSLITFRNERADVILPPTRSVELAQKMLSEIPTGGSTPLFQGLIKSIEIIQHELDAKTGYAPIIILITDGRTNVDESVTIDDIEKASKHIGKMGIELIVIDTEDVDFKIGVSQMIAESIGGKYYHIETLDSEYIQNILNIENLVE